MGMLKDQEDRERQVNNSSATPPTTSTEPKKEEEVPSWFGPMNASLHSIKNEFSTGLTSLKSEIDQLRGPAQPETVDPNLPPEVAPVYQRVNALNKDFTTLALRQEESRARDALRDARSKYKEFQFSDDDLRNMWGNHIKGNINKAAATDWDAYFRVQYETQVNPRLMSENEKLKAEIARYKNGGNQVDDLLSVPRANRQSAAASQLAEASQGDGLNEELYLRARNKVSKGNFRGFNRALVEEQAKMKILAV